MPPQILDEKKTIHCGTKFLHILMYGLLSVHNRLFSRTYSLVRERYTACRRSPHRFCYRTKKKILWRPREGSRHQQQVTTADQTDRTRPAHAAKQTGTFNSVSHTQAQDFSAGQAGFTLTHWCFDPVCSIAGLNWSKCGQDSINTTAGTKSLSALTPC